MDIILAIIHLRKFSITLAEFCSLVIPIKTDLKLSKISGKVGLNEDLKTPEIKP